MSWLLLQRDFQASIILIWVRVGGNVPSQPFCKCWKQSQLSKLSFLTIAMINLENEFTTVFFSNSLPLKVSSLSMHYCDFSVSEVEKWFFFGYLLSFFYAQLSKRVSITIVSIFPLWIKFNYSRFRLHVSLKLILPCNLTTALHKETYSLFFKYPLKTPKPNMNKKH